MFGRKKPEPEEPRNAFGQTGSMALKMMNEWYQQEREWRHEWVEKAIESSERAREFERRLEQAFAAEQVLSDDNVRLRNDNARLREALRAHQAEAQSDSLGRSIDRFAATQAEAVRQFKSMMRLRHGS